MHYLPFNAFFVTCILSISASFAGTFDTTEPRKLLESVVVSDGISESEAQSIAQAYFLTHIGCGEFLGITNGPAWVVEAKVGYSGTRATGFLIDKANGKITSPVGPSYSGPNELLVYVNKLGKVSQ